MERIEAPKEGARAGEAMAQLVAGVERSPAESWAGIAAGAVWAEAFPSKAEWETAARIASRVFWGELQNPRRRVESLECGEGRTLQEHGEVTDWMDRLSAHDRKTSFIDVVAKWRGLLDAGGLREHPEPRLRILLCIAQNPSSNLMIGRFLGIGWPHPTTDSTASSEMRLSLPTDLWPFGEAGRTPVWDWRHNPIQRHAVDPRFILAGSAAVTWRSGADSRGGGSDPGRIQMWAQSGAGLELSRSGVTCRLLNTPGGEPITWSGVRATVARLLAERIVGDVSARLEPDLCGWLRFEAVGDRVGASSEAVKWHVHEIQLRMVSAGFEQDIIQIEGGAVRFEPELLVAESG
jgi:hypothetical protein